MRRHAPPRARLALGTAVSAAVLAIAAACSDSSPKSPTAAVTSAADSELPTHDQLRAALQKARNTPNGGLNLDMWATVVDRSGNVVAVAFTGAKEGDQWQGSRVISAQKANTANAFSLPTLALSTANLYFATQPGGTLFGLQESNPVDPGVAYGGDIQDYGTAQDPMIGKRIGGINVFGGGVALYASDGTLLGGLGVSGDMSCADHNIVWKTRSFLGLDHVPAGVSPPPKFDNIIYDLVAGPDSIGDLTSKSGFGHPTCTAATTAISDSLPMTFPIHHNK